MNGLYRLFLGDARPNSVNDEWVFSDVDSIQDMIIPAARIALKVHQVGGRGMAGGRQGRLGREGEREGGRQGRLGREGWREGGR